MILNEFGPGGAPLLRSAIEALHLDILFKSFKSQNESCAKIGIVQQVMKTSNGSSGWVRGLRNMKSMRPPLAAIFLWLNFTGPARGGMAP